MRLRHLQHIVIFSLLSTILFSTDLFAQARVHKTHLPKAQHNVNPSEQLSSPLNEQLSDKLFLEGTMSTTIGNPTQIAFTPSLRWQAFKMLSIGVGPSFYYNSSDSLSSLADSSFHYGANVYTRFSPNPKTPYLQLEYAGINQWQAGTTARKWFSQLLIGAGYTFQFKKKAGLQVAVFRHLTWLGQSPENYSPWSVRIGASTTLGGQGVNSLDKLKNRKSLSQLAPTLLQNLINDLNIEGNIGASFGENKTVDFAPIFKKEIGKGFAIGGGPSIQYVYNEDEQISTTNYGARFLTRYTPKRKLPFLQLEYEALYASNEIEIPDNKSWNHAAFLGTGVVVAMRDMNARFTLLRNLTWKGESDVYTSPWVFRMAFEKGKDTPKIIKNPQKVNKKKSIHNDKLSLSGNISASFTDTVSIEFLPLLDYRFHPMWSVGLGPSLQYRKVPNEHKEILNYGANAYTRFFPKPQFPYIQVEYQGLSIKENESNNHRIWTSSMLAGLGYQMKIEEQTAIGVSVLRRLMSNVTNEALPPWVVRFSVTSSLGDKLYEAPNKKGVKDLEATQLKEKWEGKPFIGGNIGLAFGENTQIDFSPLIGYEWKRFSVGGGPSYQFIKEKQLDEMYAIYGFRLFGRLKPSENLPIFTQLEGEALNSPNGEVLHNKKIREWYSSVLLGGGISYPILDKATFNITALRNLTWDSATPIHETPWVVRLGFQF